MAGVVTACWRRGRRKCGALPVLIGVVVVIFLLWNSYNGEKKLLGGIIEWHDEPISIGMGHRPKRSRPKPERQDVDDAPEVDEVDEHAVHRRNPALNDDEPKPEPEPDVTKNQPAGPDLSPFASVQMFSQPDCQGEMSEFDSLHTEHKCVRCFDTCRAGFPNKSPMLNKIRSYRVRFQMAGRGGGRMPPAWSVSSYQVCAGSFGYSEDALADATVDTGLRPESGCVRIEAGKEPNMIRFDGMVHPDDIYTPQSYHVVYSAESSGYFGFQAYANLYGFQNSGQQTDPPTGYTRLLTAQGYDDISTHEGGVIPTFAAPRDPYSLQYSPFNKAHALTAFMNDPISSPKEEVIVIIDPDNWLVNNLAPIAAKVKPGHGVAAAAFYDGNPLVTDLFVKHICTMACDFVPDTVAVPYFVHRDDAKNIAPLYAALTKKVRQVFSNRVHARTYESLQPGWCAEMYGYIFAAAELRVRHTIVPGLQIRDVDGDISSSEAIDRRIRMIHMGRAWFPTDYAHSVTPQWIHTEGRDLRPPNTEQVWCKCNSTAGDELPWPLPAKIDFVSNITLTYLHESREKWGKPPTNKYRRSYHSRWD